MSENILETIIIADDDNISSSGQRLTSKERSNQSILFRLLTTIVSERDEALKAIRFSSTMTYTKRKLIESSQYEIIEFLDLHRERIDMAAEDSIVNYHEYIKLRNNSYQTILSHLQYEEQSLTTIKNKWQLRLNNFTSKIIDDFLINDHKNKNDQWNSKIIWVENPDEDNEYDNDVNNNTYKKKKKTLLLDNSYNENYNSNDNNNNKNKKNIQKSSEENAILYHIQTLSLLLINNQTITKEKLFSLPYNIKYSYNSLILYHHHILLSLLLRDTIIRWKNRLELHCIKLYEEIFFILIITMRQYSNIKYSIMKLREYINNEENIRRKNEEEKRKNELKLEKKNNSRNKKKNRNIIEENLTEIIIEENYEEKLIREKKYEEYYLNNEFNKLTLNDINELETKELNDYKQYLNNKKKKNKKKKEKNEEKNENNDVNNEDLFEKQEKDYQKQQDLYYNKYYLSYLSYFLPLLMQNVKLFYELLLEILNSTQEFIQNDSPDGIHRNIFTNNLPINSKYNEKLNFCLIVIKFYLFYRMEISYYINKFTQILSYIGYNQKLEYDFDLVNNIIDEEPSAPATSSTSVSSNSLSSNPTAFSSKLSTSSGNIPSKVTETNIMQNELESNIHNLLNSNLEAENIFIIDNFDHILNKQFLNTEEEIFLNSLSSNSLNSTTNPLSNTTTSFPSDSYRIKLNKTIKESKSFKKSLICHNLPLIFHSFKRNFDFYMHLKSFSYGSYNILSDIFKVSYFIEKCNNFFNQNNIHYKFLLKYNNMIIKDLNLDMKFEKNNVNNDENIKKDNLLNSISKLNNSKNNINKSNKDNNKLSYNNLFYFEKYNNNFNIILNNLCYNILSFVLLIFNTNLIKFGNRYNLKALMITSPSYFSTIENEIIEGLNYLNVVKYYKKRNFYDENNENIDEFSENNGENSSKSNNNINKIKKFYKKIYGKLILKILLIAREFLFHRIHSIFYSLIYIKTLKTITTEILQIKDFSSFLWPRIKETNFIDVDKESDKLITLPQLLSLNIERLSTILLIHYNSINITYHVLFLLRIILNPNSFITVSSIEEFFLKDLVKYIYVYYLDDDFQWLSSSILANLFIQCNMERREYEEYQNLIKKIDNNDGTDENKNSNKSKNVMFRREQRKKFKQTMSIKQRKMKLLNINGMTNRENDDIDDEDDQEEENEGQNENQKLNLNENSQLNQSTTSSGATLPPSILIFHYENEIFPNACLGGAHWKVPSVLSHAVSRSYNSSASALSMNSLSNFSSSTVNITQKEKEKNGNKSSNTSSSSSSSSTISSSTSSSSTMTFTQLLYKIMETHIQDEAILEQIFLLLYTCSLKSQMLKFLLLEASIPSLCLRVKNTPNYSLYTRALCDLALDALEN